MDCISLLRVCEYLFPEQSELGEVVFVDLPETGAAVTKGKTFGVVESVKAASDVYSPVSGEVVEANKDLSDNPGLVSMSFPFAVSNSHYVMHG